MMALLPAHVFHGRIARVDATQATHCTLCQQQLTPVRNTGVHATLYRGAVGLAKRAG